VISAEDIGRSCAASERRFAASEQRFGLRDARSTEWRRTTAPWNWPLAGMAGRKAHMDSQTPHDDARAGDRARRSDDAD